MLKMKKIIATIKHVQSIKKKKITCRDLRKGFERIILTIKDIETGFYILPKIQGLVMKLHCNGSGNYVDYV